MRILGNNVTIESRCVDNVNTMLIGAPGTGKTRTYVLPNMMSAEEESLVILDPKGEIHDMSANLMKKKGYKVRVLDFAQPELSQVSYNPLYYCRDEEDILKLTALLVDDQKVKTSDMFWPLTSQILCNALVSFLKKYRPEEDQHLGSLVNLLRMATVSEDMVDEHLSPLDKAFAEVKKRNANDWGLSQYEMIKRGAARTQKSVIISLCASFSGLMTPQMTEMMSEDNVDIESLCKEKTALYVRCSDTDRSKDTLVALFFMQLFQELYRIADSSPSHTLPLPIHVMLDDVGANLKIPNMDGIISTSRGRGISLSIILQSVGQLKKQYSDYTSIINSCNNVIFLGGSDIETCKEMATRLDKPLGDVLYKPSNVIYIFRQGEKPVKTTTYDLTKHPHYHLLNNCYNVNDVKQKEEMLI